MFHVVISGRDILAKDADGMYKKTKFEFITIAFMVFVAL